MSFCLHVIITDFRFPAVGTGDSPCDITWPGYFPFSDPEALHLANFLLNTNGGRWKLFFTMHSYGQLWMAPYGYTTEPVVDYDKLASFELQIEREYFIAGSEESVEFNLIFWTGFFWNTLTIFFPDSMILANCQRRKHPSDILILFCNFLKCRLKLDKWL